MKVIFLDIDGVLNNDTTKEHFKLFTGLSPHLVKTFKDWYKTKDYQIVLSSTWRKDEEFMQHLNENGIFWHSVTPQIHGYQRGFEIQMWLLRNECEKYAILDDMNAGEFLPNQRKYLVQTSYVHGLRSKDLKKVEKILS